MSKIEELNNNEVVCFECGCVINIDDEFYDVVNGKIICSDCFNDNYVYCSHCETVHHIDDITYLENYDRYVCDNCLDGYYRKCIECGEYVHMYDSWFSTETHFDYCEYCFHETHAYCDNCGEYVLNDNYNWDLEMCCNCAEDYYDDDDSYIGSYHSHDYRFIGNSNKENNIWFKGIELEIENNREDYMNNDLAEKLHSLINYENNHIYCENDGSLYNGFEIITHPHTFEEFYKINWEKLLNTCRDYGFISHDTKTCGLHIHYSREFFGNDFTEQSSNIAKLIYFYEKNIDDILKISRRTWTQYVQWADSYHTNCNIDNCIEIANNNRCNGRYHFINLCNYNTIEFRLGRGTLNYNSFMAWNDFHDTIVKNVKNISFDEIDNIEKWLCGIKRETLMYLKNKETFKEFYM